MLLQKAVAAIFLLFVLCFVAIIIEETCLAGRRRRGLEKMRRKQCE